MSSSLRSLTSSGAAAWKAMLLEDAAMDRYIDNISCNIKNKRSGKMLCAVGSSG